jgi:hypothetical protein
VEDSKIATGILILDVESGQIQSLVPRFLVLNYAPSNIYSLAFSSDGKKIGIAGDDLFVGIWILE